MKTSLVYSLVSIWRETVWTMTKRRWFLQTLPALEESWLTLSAVWAMRWCVRRNSRLSFYPTTTTNISSFWLYFRDGTRISTRSLLHVQMKFVLAIVLMEGELGPAALKLRTRISSGKAWLTLLKIYYEALTVMVKEMLGWEFVLVLTQQHTWLSISEALHERAFRFYPKNERPESMNMIRLLLGS